jgi:16S rRNA (guanine527-N7)-methyltransferase
MLAAHTLLINGLEKMNIVLTETQMKHMMDYLNLLLKWNKTYSITAITSMNEMVIYHILDSLALYPYVEKQHTLLDVGSGGGMPGIPLAIACPHVAVTLIDINQKKTAFLRQAIMTLGLSNATAITSRVEQFDAPQGFDIITSRAFSSLPMFVTLSHHLLAENGCFWAMKGQYPHEELTNLPMHYHAVQVLPVDIPYLDAERHLIAIQGMHCS